MRKPNIGKTLEKAKEAALQYFESEDWRFQFLAVYLLQFYMNPREIMHFLNTQPAVIRNNLEALKKIRRDHKLIRLDSLKKVLDAKLDRPVQIQKTRKVVM